jgi:uncharacterized membrane protein
MGIGTSIVLIAVGAILAFAVDLSSKVGSTVVHWDTVGWILMIVGVLGLLLSMLWLSSARHRGRAGPRRRAGSLHDVTGTLLGRSNGV